MYSVSDLFDKRSVVGIKLEKIIVDRGYTKVEISNEVGISRPTLNKILTGTLTSKINYEKHLEKIMKYLSVTPDVLLGGVINKNIRAKEIKQIMRINSKEISKQTGIPLTRLMEIDAGANATLAELRDIAMCLSVSVKCLLGEHFFEPQIATLDVVLSNNVNEKRDKYSGFWGHIGIQLCNDTKFLWYPITGKTRDLVYKTVNNNRIVIPCMNNKVLFINMKNVNEIVFSDFDCDQPEFINWDYEVDCGEIPLVIYEILEEYDFIEDDEKNISVMLRDWVEKFVDNKGLSEDEIYDKTHISKIYYLNGCIRNISIDFNSDESVSDEIYCTYIFEDTEFENNILFCQDIGGTEIFLNMKNICMLELPFLHVEHAIQKGLNELLNEI